VVAGKPAPRVAELGFTTDADYAAMFRVLSRLREELRDLMA
jgi:hypothetical protein